MNHEIPNDDFVKSETGSKPFMTIPEIHGIFVDDFLVDEADNLIFGSFWGRDTSIREFQGRLTLGYNEGGLTTFYIIRTNDDASDKKTRSFVKVGNIDTLDQMTGRVQTRILGDLVHCWLYQREVVKPDFANHRATLISRHEEPDNLWGVIKAVCPIPLLDHWADIVIPELYSAGMIKKLSGINQTGLKVAIDEDEIALLIKNRCIDGSLTVETYCGAHYA